MVKLCLFCKYCVYREPGAYSTMTDFPEEIHCARGHWGLYGGIGWNGLAKAGERFTRAETCPDYTLTDEIQKLEEEKAKS